jgi:hypothetical protein
MERSIQLAFISNHASIPYHKKEMKKTNGRLDFWQSCTLDRDPTCHHFEVRKENRNGRPRPATKTSSWMVFMPYLNPKSFRILTL